MRVLHVIPSLSAVHGGPTQAMASMEHALREQGVHLEIATTDDDGPDRHMAVPLGQAVAHAGTTHWYFPKRTEFYKVSPGLARWLAREAARFDLLHLHALFSFSTTAAARAARKAGVPYVVRPLGTLNHYGLTQLVFHPETPGFEVVERVRAESVIRIDGEVVDFLVTERSRVAGQRLRDLALPDGVLVAMIVRGADVIPPRGSTRVLAGDHAFVLLRPAVRGLVERSFADAGDPAWRPATAIEFPLRGSTRIAELEEFYGVRIEAPGDATLAELLRDRLDRAPVVGDVVSSGPLTLIVREIEDDRAETVGLVIEPEE